MKWYKTHILTTATFRELEPMLAQCNLRTLATTKSAPGRVPKVPDLENQKDLMKMVSILLSTGINRNDDVFLPSEVLPVRNTGAHKPVNLEHDPTKIVGHLIRTYATEKSGKKVPDGKKPKGKAFDITTESVLYSFLFPGLAKDIRERADSDSLFVSVEVWFTEFDFLVGSKIIKRTSETASVLEPKLKISGGPGFFEGQRLGRVLRNMIIGGMGIVRDPANPESIVKSVSGFNSEVVQDIENEVVSTQVMGDIFADSTPELEEVDNVTMEVSMNPDIIEEMAAVATACEAAAETSEDLSETEVTQADEQAVASADLRNNPLFKALAARLESLEAKNEELEAAQRDAEFKAECSRREAKLRELGMDDSEVLSDILTSRSMFSMTKEQFDMYVGLLTRGINAIGKSEEQATASADEAETATEETAEDTTEVTAEAEAQEEAPEAAAEEVKEEETKEPAAAEEPAAEEPAAETAEEPAAEGETGEAEGEAETIEDEIEVEIEAVDPEINTKTGETDKEPDLVDQMADVAALFLQQKDNKWGKLALNK
jgi:hypothetical protein